ncbi:hypothetical protein T10_13210 [Trichinella papuae]|uniref:Uncharacterized protein n=1 Tax=Trichinella papuae TaxID=268474 RepID=A0A0V1MIC4_9BILA|nr:hypothetical protein T10_13210 [Trichinella papuae]
MKKLMNVGNFELNDETNGSNSSSVESGGAVSEVGRCSSLVSKRLLSMCHHYQRISVMHKPRTQAAISQFCPSVTIFIG